MGLELVTPPAAEPITRAEAKTHLRVDGTEEDTYIDGLIAAARLEAERISWRQLVTATWKLSLDRFPSWAIFLPRPKLQSVSSITYLDTTGTQQTLDAAKYRVDTKAEPGRITPAFDETWPATRNVTNAVTVTFVAGYGAASAVPEPAKHWLKLYLSQLYWFREPLTERKTHSIPYDGLLDPVRDDRIFRWAAP